MYTEINFPTKKALREAVQAGIVKPIRVFQPGPFADQAPKNGRVSIEGPHYPQPHKWYATVEIKDGVIVKFIR